MDFNKLAKILVNYSTRVKSGDLVWVRYDPLAARAALAVQEEVLRAGGGVIFDSQPDGSLVALLTLGSNQELDRMNPMTMWLAENADARIFLQVPTNLRELSSINPERISRRGAVNKPMSDCLMDRQSDGRLSWVGTELPTQARAQEAGLSFSQFEEFVIRAGLLHLSDPIGYWQRFDVWQQTVVDSLNNNRRIIHIEGSNIDLGLSVAYRNWINCSGQHNFPDGEVFTGPIENSANGWLQLTFPAYYKGNVVENARLEFEDGRVVKATASQGEDFLIATLDTDEGASLLGELGIGTNEGITHSTGSILFDEKMTRTVHLAVGSGFPETGSQNQSAIHWDLIIPMGDGRIQIDGETVYEEGTFTIGQPAIKPAID